MSFFSFEALKLNYQENNFSAERTFLTPFTIRVAKTKALISFAVTAKLICAFVFAYADCWFSHGGTQIYCWFSHGVAQIFVLLQGFFLTFWGIFFEL